MTEPTASAETENAQPRRGYKREEGANPLTGCVDFNALHDELKAAEAQPELSVEEAPRSRRG